jgi:hypothetical protein
MMMTIQVMAIDNGESSNESGLNDSDPDLGKSWKWIFRKFPGRTPATHTRWNMIRPRDEYKTATSDFPRRPPPFVAIREKVLLDLV